MSKVKTAYFCQNCGHESAKWSGKCPSCGQWNTFVEELVQKDAKKANPAADWGTTTAMRQQKRSTPSTK
jgi:DNA repair protein RadA/Sms